MALTVHAYGNVDALHGIFNAVAMVMSSGDFEAMVRVGVVIGFIVVATLAAFPGNLQKGINWFIAVAVISGAMLLPKTEVVIEDRLGIQATAVVANVPWTLAMLASVKSSIGYSLTELTETAFQTIPAADKALPTELSYLRTGTMFGSRLVEASRSATPASIYDQMDLVMYVRNCVLPEQGRAFTPDAIARSMALLEDFGDSNPALPTAYHDPDDNWRTVVAPCPTAWAKLQTRLDAAGAAAVIKVARQVSPEKYKNDPAAAIADAEAAIPVTYAKASLANAASTASQVMLQNILINATADAAASEAAATGDTETLMLAMMRAQAVGTQNAGNTVQGKLAEEALPLIRNLTEAILIAMFPVLCVVLVASETRAMGSLFKSYVYMMVWVELWPPMFAIVNYLQTLEAAKELAAAAHMPTTTGLSIATASSIYSTAVSGKATAAWFITFVPLLAAAVLFGFDRMLAVTGAMGGGVKAAQGEAATASVKGNVAMGNVSMDRVSTDAYRSTPSMMTNVGVGGTEVRDLISGQRVSTYASSQHLSSAGAVASIGQRVTAAAQAAEAATQRNQKSYETSLDAAFTAAKGAMLQDSKSAEKALGYDVSKVGTNGLTAQEVTDTARSIADQFGITDTSMVSKQLQLAMGGLLNKAGIVPLMPSASSTEQEQLAKVLTHQAQALQRQGLARKHDIAETFKSSDSFKEARSSNRSATDRVESSLREAASYKEAAGSDFARSQQLRSDWQAFQDYAQSNRTDFGNIVEQEFMRRGMTVLDGVADPRAHAEVIRTLFEQGSFREDGPGGTRLFIPAGPGLGPSENMVAPAMAIAERGAQGLQDFYTAGPANAGRSDVLTAGQRFDTREADRERTLGVRAGAAVDGAAVKGRVAAGQQSAESKTAAEGRRVAGEQGEVQLEYEQRAGTVSRHHTPVFSQNPVTGASIKNTALDATREQAAGSDRAFPQQAEAAEALQREAATREQQTADRFYSELGVAQIPGLPAPAQIPSAPPTPLAPDLRPEEMVLRTPAPGSSESTPASQQPKTGGRG